MVTPDALGGRSIGDLGQGVFQLLGQERRTWKSLAWVVGKESLVFANQVEFQGLVIPRRMPLDVLSDPLLISSLSVGYHYSDVSGTLEDTIRSDLGTRADALHGGTFVYHDGGNTQASMSAPSLCSAFAMADSSTFFVRTAAFSG